MRTRCEIHVRVKQFNACFSTNNFPSRINVCSASRKFLWGIANKFLVFSKNNLFKNVLTKNTDSYLEKYPKNLDFQHKPYPYSYTITLFHDFAILN